MTGRHRLEGVGSDLRLTVAGPDHAACLEAAVRGFAEAVAGGPLPRGAAREQRPVELAGDSPADLLVGLVDELVFLLDAEGLLACGLEVHEAGETALRGRLTLVAPSGVTLDGVTPKAATWHGVRLGPAVDGWEGSVVVDL